MLYRGNNGKDLPPLIMLSLGVTDLPFGFELLESSRVRPFMERSLGSSALFPTEMDVGLKLSGAVSFVRYAFAVTNGEPVDTLNRYPRDPNAAKDFSGRVGVETQPLAALSIAGGTSFYQGTGFHAGTDATKPSFTWLDINEDRAIQPNELQAVPGASAQPSTNFKRWAYGLDLELVSAHEVRHHALGRRRVSGLEPGSRVSDRRSYAWVRTTSAKQAVTWRWCRTSRAGARSAFARRTTIPNSDFFDSLRGRQVPTSLSVTTLSPMVALRWQDTARLSFQYDFVRDSLAKDASGVPTDAKNNQLTLRLQVEL